MELIHTNINKEKIYTNIFVPDMSIHSPIVDQIRRYNAVTGVDEHNNRLLITFHGNADQFQQFINFLNRHTD